MMDKSKEYMEAKLKAYERSSVKLCKRINKLEADRDKYKHFYEKKSKFLKTTLKRLDDSSWENEQELKALLKRYHDHVCTAAPLTWASHGDGKYAEQAHQWEIEWQVLKEEVEALC